jgi:uncharacterized protein
MTEVVDNPTEGRFELRVDTHMAYATYRIKDGLIYIDYVYSPPPLRGSGAAGQLMEGVMASVRTQGLKLIPICGYAATWLKRHSEFGDLLA